MKRKKRKPEVAAGYFAVIGGALCLGIGMFSMSSANKYGAAGCGVMGLSWGLKELAAAKKWEQEPEEGHYAKTSEERREAESYEKLEKSGSMRNVSVLLGWVFLFVAVAAVIGLGYLFWFHHRP